MLLRPTNVFIYNLARDESKMQAIDKNIVLLNITSKNVSLLYNVYFGPNT